MSLPDHAWATDLPIERVPAAVAQLAALSAILASRMMGEDSSGTPEHKSPAPEWNLSIDDLVARTSKSRRWIFAHADELPFVGRITRKTLRGEALLTHWLSERRTGNSARKRTPIRSTETR